MHTSLAETLVGNANMRMHRAIPASLALTLIAVTACSGSGGDDGGSGPAIAQAAPTASIAAPPGASVNRTVTLTATATAEAGVNRVQFLVDGNVIGTATAAPYQTSWDTSTVPDGAHQLTAVTIDNANASTTSAPVTVTVLNSPTIDVTVSSAEVFPRTGSAATGVGQFTFNLVTGAVTGTVTFTGIAATLSDIHQGIAGTNGPPILTLSVSGTDPNSWVAPAGATLTADQVNALLAGELYVDAHSATFPDGEIRGQLRPQGIDVAVTDMSGANVVPPATNSATGFAAMTVNETAGTATVHVQTSGVDDATAASVSTAPTGQTASAPLFSLMKDPALASHWFLEGQPFTQDNLAALSAGMLYVDVLTPASPAGALRGQLALVMATPPTPPVPAVTLSQLQSTIFTPICSVCHTGGGSSLPASMDLTSSAATFAAIVGVASTEVPSLLRVNPGNPDASYLVHKVEGAPDIVGSRMPLGGAPLDPTSIANIRAWISAGAQNN